MVDTLEYMKKGGRITPAAAAPVSYPHLDVYKRQVRGCRRNESSWSSRHVRFPRAASGAAA